MAKIKSETRDPRFASGSSLALAVIALTILTTLGFGLLTVGYGARHQAAAIKGNLAAMLAAEAGYEKAVFWMTQQQDMLNALQQSIPGTTGMLTFPDSSCTYQISLFSFAGSRPVFRIVSHGYGSQFERYADVLVVQAASGWDMGTCQCPSGSGSFTGVYFTTGETMDMPICINKTNDDPDVRDIFVSGTPDFQQPVTLGEARLTAGGSDKYADVISLFDAGIYFDQPASRVTDESSVQTKVTRFRNTTKTAYRFTPTAGASSISNRMPVTQLEFFVEGGVGKVRITNNGTAQGFRQNNDSKTWDFKIHPGSGGTQFDRYFIYAYHVVSNNADTNGDRRTVALTDTYVSQSFGTVQSEPGGQIYVDGNVVIGGNATSHDNNQCVKGKITVVATGNIWVADNILMEGSHDAAGMPTADNPNALGLLAQGVIKVADPGLSDLDGRLSISGYAYAPVGKPVNPSATPGQSGTGYYQRYLPDPTVVEAALTIGGGGWGAENVTRHAGKSSYGGRKMYSDPQDYLEVHGTISEAIRGVVGLPGENGYLKNYHMDRRLLTGIIPGEIALRGKYVPAPAGWRDYRPGG
jgi:hypothetical protein